MLNQALLRLIWLSHQLKQKKPQDLAIDVDEMTMGEVVHLDTVSMDTFASNTSDSDEDMISVGEMARDDQISD